MEGAKEAPTCEMSVEPNADLQLEIGYLLLIDVVGYSKLLVNEQVELLQELNQIVRSTPSFRNAEATGKLIRLPTGDGMALVFFPQSGRTGPMRFGNSRGIEEPSTASITSGRSQWPGQSDHRCE